MALTQHPPSADYWWKDRAAVGAAVMRDGG